MRNEQIILDLVKDYIGKGVFPGANFAVIEEEKIQEYLLGNASVFPEKIPLTKGEFWDLASVTKVVGTGTAVIDLVFSGQIELEQPLKKYYPAFKDNAVTIRQLLTHTTGLNPYIPNRDSLNKEELKTAINQLEATEDKAFRYTDINFILLGFMLEEIYQADLGQIFQDKIFEKWGMTETQFGPVKNAVPTAQNIPTGTVHDPKAQVLGKDCGSAGLFSTLPDLVKFVRGYFEDEKYLELLKNYASGEKKRSLAWDLLGEADEWLLHTGYTGTFLMINPRDKKAVIFLSNRVHLKDERVQWIKDRDILIELFIENL